MLISYRNGPKRRPRLSSVSTSQLFLKIRGRRSNRERWLCWSNVEPSTRLTCLSSAAIQRPRVSTNSLRYKRKSQKYPNISDCLEPSTVLLASSVSKGGTQGTHMDLWWRSWRKKQKRIYTVRNSSWTWCVMQWSTSTALQVLPPAARLPESN